MQEERLSGKLSKDLAVFEQRFEQCFDFVLRKIQVLNGTAAAVLFIDGLVNKDQVQENILEPLIEIEYRNAPEKKKPRTIEEIEEKLLTAVDVEEQDCFEKILDAVLSGDTVLVIDGSAEALVIQTRYWMNRGVQEPQTQLTVRGPREGFTETILFNTSLLRRKIKNTALKTEIMTVGKVTKTYVCIAYVKGIADESLIEEVRKRIGKIDVDYILESGHIEQLIDSNPRSLFATAGNNEKPDIVAAKLMKGRVAILVDGTPFVLTAPMLFVENFQSAEDYYTRPFYANFLRVLRVFAYILTLLLPAVYVALTTFHQEMIPTQLLVTLMRAREGIPFPTFVEMLLTLILYELLRESVLRLPSPVAGTVGIVGAFIIGEAAVGAGIIGGPVVVIGALTFITSAVVNPLSDSTAILRIALLLLGAVFGIFGVFVGLFAIFAHLCSLNSFGIPYLMPISPLSKRGIRDSLIRGNMKKILKRDA